MNPGHSQVPKGIQIGGLTSEFIQSVKCCAILKSKIKCRDYERNIYEKLNLAFDWRKIDEIYVEFCAVLIS